MDHYADYAVGALKGAVWVLYHTSNDCLPTFSEPQYWIKIPLYAAIAIYLFYLYQSKYAKKEVVVLAIPLLYLIFFSLPLGFLKNNIALLTFFLKFYPGLTVPVLLLFAYLVKVIATAVELKKAGAQQKKEKLSSSPTLEKDVS